MKQITYEITNPLGMHARPAAFVAQACVALPSQITIKCDNKVANGDNVLQILALDAQQGSFLKSLPKAAMKISLWKQSEANSNAD